MDGDIQRLTNGNTILDENENIVWVGTGVFDKLIEAVNANLSIQFDNGRITKEQYASVYLGALQTVIQQAIQYELRGFAK